MTRWNEVRAASLAWHSTIFVEKNSTESTNFNISTFHLYRKISGAAPSAERHGSHGSHGSCNVKRAWHLPHVASCQVRDRMVSTSICCKLVHSLMTREFGIFLRWRILKLVRGELSWEVSSEAVWGRSSRCWMLREETMGFLDEAL